MTHPRHRIGKGKCHPLVSVPPPPLTSNSLPFQSRHPSSSSLAWPPAPSSESTGPCSTQLPHRPVHPLLLHAYPLLPLHPTFPSNTFGRCHGRQYAKGVLRCRRPRRIARSGTEGRSTVVIIQKHSVQLFLSYLGFHQGCFRSPPPLLSRPSADVPLKSPIKSCQQFGLANLH